MVVKKYNNLGIGVKTLLSHIALALCVVVLSSALTYALTYRYVRDALIADLQNTTARIAETMHTETDGGFRPSTRVVRIIQDLTNARVFFLEQEDSAVPGRSSVSQFLITDSRVKRVDRSQGVHDLFFGRIAGNAAGNAERLFLRKIGSLNVNHTDL